MAGYKSKLKDGYGTGGTRKGAAGSRNAAEDFGKASAGISKGARTMNRAGQGAKAKARRDPKGGVPGGGLNSFRK